MRQTVTVTFPRSEWVKSASHNFRGVLTIETMEGKQYKFRAPAETIRQASRIAERQRANPESRVSPGKWVNTVVFNGGYERLS